MWGQFVEASVLTGRTLPSVPTPPCPCRLDSGRQARRQSQALPPSQGASGRLGAPSSSRQPPCSDSRGPLWPRHCGRKGWTGGVGPDRDNLGSTQREQSRCLGSPQSGEQLQGLSGAPPPHLQRRPRESRIIGFDLCPESSVGRDRGSCSPDGGGMCHSGREQRAER